MLLFLILSTLLRIEILHFIVFCAAMPHFICSHISDLKSERYVVRNYLSALILVLCSGLLLQWISFEFFYIITYTKVLFHFFEDDFVSDGIYSIPMISVIAGLFFLLRLLSLDHSMNLLLSVISLIYIVKMLFDLKVDRKFTSLYFLLALGFLWPFVYPYQNNIFSWQTSFGLGLQMAHGILWFIYGIGHLKRRALHVLSLATALLFLTTGFVASAFFIFDFVEFYKKSIFIMVLLAFSHSFIREYYRGLNLLKDIKIKIFIDYF